MWKGASFVHLMTLSLGCLAFPSLSFAQGCDILKLKKITHAQGQLFAVSSRNNSGIPIRLSPTEFASTDLNFDSKLSLIYVLDNPPGVANPFAVKRDNSGVFAVRMVSTSADGTKRQPTYVYLKRDKINTSRGQRESWNGSISARTYYTYHHPRALRASSSYLEREFHAEYTYRDDAPDRATYEPRERRSEFHFPEMKVTEPTDAASRLLSSVFGSGTAFADSLETRFEAQIKYYRQSTEPRCITMNTGIEAADNGTLNVTMTDLDYPRGLQDRESREVWRIKWRKQ